MDTALHHGPLPLGEKNPCTETGNAEQGITGSGNSRAILPLKLEGVSYAVQGKTLVRGLNLEFGPGTRTLLLGPNGAGKSLTLRLCHGLIEPSAGKIQWAENAGANSWQARRRQAMVFQRPVLLRRPALHNITYALALRGMPRALRNERAMLALEQTGLAEVAQRQARVLSAGEQQRLALARAWAVQPDVLFLDEPTANLDPAASRRVEEIVNSIHQSGTKIIMTTHDLGQAKRLADEVIFMHRGRLIEQAAASEFFDSPRTQEARAFLEGELLW